MSEWRKIVISELKPLMPSPMTWMVTGAAGFIGSNITDLLLSLGQKVIAVDNLSTGSMRNIEDLKREHPDHFELLKFYRLDINDMESLKPLLEQCEHILHQAALGSVARSINSPLVTHHANVTGFLNLLEAARTCGKKRVVFASSSSVYGSDDRLPKIESQTGRPLSPYAASKRCDELYAAAFAQVYGTELVGLRYFNVFGPRQSPLGPYAAVIPIWSEAITNDRSIKIYGDGLTSRDFCFVGNIVVANIRAALTPALSEPFNILNIAAGATTSLNSLAELLHSQISKAFALEHPLVIERENFRTGDIRHSLADITTARAVIGYTPLFDVKQGIRHYTDWLKQWGNKYWS